MIHRGLRPPQPTPQMRARDIVKLLDEKIENAERIAELAATQRDRYPVNTVAWLHKNEYCLSMTGKLSALYELRHAITGQ